MTDRIQLGATLPLSDIGGDPATVSAYAQAAGALGYDHLCATDHVLGVNAASRLRSLAREAGRDPAEIGLEVWMAPVGEPNAWCEEVRFWKGAGVTHITCNSSFGRYHHKRIPQRTLAAHIADLERFIDAVRHEL